MTTAYDWSRLDEGWRYADGTLHRKYHSEWSFEVETGGVGIGTVEQFRELARAQVEKCRIQWHKEVTDALLEVGGNFQTSTIEGAVNVSAVGDTVAFPVFPVTLVCSSRRWFSYTLCGGTNPIAPCTREFQRLSDVGNRLLAKGWTTKP